jgi:AraC family L-rhamnose operon regulatory protein RhaS
MVVRARPGQQPKQVSPRTDFEEPQQVAGLRHIGYDLFADATPEGLKPHRHDGAFELCYIRRGSLNWWIEDRTYAIAPGDVFLTLPNEWHGGRHGVMDACELYWLAFTLDPAGGSLGLTADETAHLDHALRGSRTRVSRGSSAMPGHFARILAAIREPQGLGAAVARGSVVLLIAELAAAFARADAALVQRSASPRIQAAMQWLQDHYAEPVALDALASQCQLKISRFRALFRAETGFSPLEYLTQVRIAAAKELLARPHLSITAIALACGFGSSQYFATAFRRSTGFTPRDYRQRGVR